MMKIGTWTVVLWLVLFCSISFYLSYVEHISINEKEILPQFKSTDTDLMMNGILLSLASVVISAIPFSFCYRQITKSRPKILVLLTVNVTIFLMCILAFFVTSGFTKSWQKDFNNAILLYSISLVLVLNLYYFLRLFSSK